MTRYLCLFFSLVAVTTIYAQTDLQLSVEKLQEFKFKNWDSVEYYASKILEITDENQHLARGLAYQYLGVAQFENKGNYDSAITLYDQSLPHFEQAGDSVKLSALYNNYGVVAKVKADYENALTYFYKANDLLANDSTANLQTTVLTNIGDVLIFMGKYEEAEQYLQLSYKAALAKNDSLKVATILATIGNLYNARQKFDEAIRYYKNSLAFQKSYAMDSSSNIMNIGVVYHFKGDLTEAISYYQKAIAVANAFNSPRNAALCYLNIGEAMIALNDPEAVSNLNRAVELASTHQLSRVLRSAHQMLATYYQQQKEYVLALEQFKLYKKYNDEIINENSLNKLNALNVKFKTTQKEQKIAAQELEIERQQASARQQRNQKIGIGAGLSFLLLIGGFFYLKARMEQRARLQQAIIQEKEKGLKAVFMATETERQRIAKDLHDGIGQQLSGVKMQLESLAVKDAKVLKKKEHIAENLAQAAKEVRQISHQMMPRALAEDGLVPALEDLFTKTFAGTSITCSFEHHNITQRFPQDIETSLYRITQELLNNIIKHAHASKVAVQLYKVKDKLVMTVEDNGIGFDIAGKGKGNGHGLLNIKSRIETVNGKIDFESSETSETVITLSIPIA
jgi:two-component system, NarL family, sensor kinase